MLNNKAIFPYALLLLCCLKLHAQQKRVGLFFEKAYLHTDRNVYSQGDDIWFKAYLVNAKNNKLTNTSNNLYVELLSPGGEIILRDIIRLDQGTGNGDFKLSDTIAPNRYRIRAYTNWMRNFGNNFIFEKAIDVVGVIKPDQKKQHPIVLPDDVSIHFYPEGGSLIEGLASIVAVKAQTSLGKGIALNVAVMNTVEDTITSFKTDSLGMGIFTLLPISGQSYTAVNRQSGRRFKIPTALLNGYILAVKQTDNLVNVVISTNDTTYKSSPVMILSAKHAGVLCLRKPITINSQQKLVLVPKSLFPEGICTITLASTDGKPQSERLLYINNSNTKNKLILRLDRSAYGPREKVSLTIKLTDTTQTAHLSMAVTDASLAPVAAQNIQNYLELTSDLVGGVEHPEIYFDTTNANRFKQLDRLMLVQGWRDFIWRRLADTSIRLSYAAENGLTISGKVRKKLVNKPIPGVNITLTAFKAKGQKLYGTQTDSAGRYSIPDVQMYGQQSITITARDNKGERSGWLLLDSLTIDPLNAAPLPEYVLDTASRLVKSVQQQHEAIKAAQNKHVLKEVKITASKTVVLSDMVATSFGYLDQDFNITKKDEYFQSLDNWLAHNVKGAIINDNPGVYFTGIGGDDDHLRGLIAPRFIVNGREVVPALGKYVKPPQRQDKVSQQISDDDFQMQSTLRQQYYDLTMSKVKHVELKHLVGSDPDNGNIIDVYVLYLTVTPDALENKDFGTEQADVTGYYEARVFYKPLYDNAADKTKPDYRTTIHWEPNITTDANGEATITYYNADPKTKIRLIIEGITDKGDVISTGAGYEVK